MSYLPSARLTNLLIFLGCCGLMSVGFIFQFALDLEPCPLCITQRFFITLTGLLALAAFVHNPQQTGLRIYAASTTLGAAIGGGFSSRQLWLQGLPPDQVPACGPSLGYMFETFPFMEAVSVLLNGNGNCAEVVWTFLGISIPGWTLVAFSGLVIISLWQLFRKS